jgi:hypothetical protein
MNVSYNGDNDTSRAWVKDFVAGLSDEDMAHPVGEHWTIAVGLAHLAFWDRQWCAKLEEWQRTGVVLVPTLRQEYNRINDGMLPWWREISPAQARHEVIAAMEAMDATIAGLSPFVVDGILAKRPRTIQRTVHRHEHIGEIQRALGREA